MVAVAFIARKLGMDSIAAVGIAVAPALALASLLRRRRGWKPRPSRMVALALPLLLVGAFTWSYTGYLLAPGAAATSVRTSDWMRDHGLGPMVDRLEQYLYNRHGPSNGPVSAGQLPTVVRVSRGNRTGVAPTTAPPPVGGLVGHSLAGEGQWTPNTRTVDGAPVTYTTFFRPDPTHTDVVAAAVWLDPAKTRITYVPGTKDPGGVGWAWGSGVPRAQRQGLVATFNAGFRFKDGVSGVFTEGRTPHPLVDEQASLVLYADGHVAIGAWGSELRRTPDVITVRQNLHLLVDGGHPVAGLRTKTAGEWGTRRWQLQYTKRSGIGITQHGALVYVMGANLSTETLADALAQAGSVRAMELDIHATNPTFNFFTPTPGTASGVTGTKLLPDVGGAANRFIAPDQRDFFAVTTAERVQP